MRDELKVWRENFVNIQDLMDEYVQLKERSKLLRDEVYDVHHYTGQFGEYFFNLFDPAGGERRWGYS